MDEIRLRRQFRSSSGKTSARIDPGYLFDTAGKTVGEDQPAEKSYRQDLLERRAALLAWVDPAVILDPDEKVTLEDKDLAAVLAACEIIPTMEGPRRRLRPDVRRAALKRMGTRAVMSEVLGPLSISTGDPIQQMLISLRKARASISRSSIATSLPRFWSLPSG